MESREYAVLLPFTQWRQRKAPARGSNAQAPVRFTSFYPSGPLYVAADPTFTMSLYRFWATHLREFPEFADYYKEIGIYTTLGKVWKLTPLHNDNPYEAERRALNDRMVAELAGAIVNFRQHDRAKGEYPIPQHDELPYFHIELRTSFAAAIAEAITRRDTGIEHLVERWYYYD